jgi:hypothetical protein
LEIDLVLISALALFERCDWSTQISLVILLGSHWSE